MSRKTFIENHPETFAEITSSDFLYQQAPCGFISFLPNGSILRVNQTFSRWLDIPEEDIYQIKIWALLNKASSMYYEMVVMPLLNVRGFANGINFSFVTKNGGLETLFNATAFKNETGNIIAINATIQDITDRKKYEAEILLAKRIAEQEKRRFEFLSNTTSHIVWTALPDGRINFVNQKAHEYMNLGLDEMKAFDGIFEEDKPVFVEEWHKAISTVSKLEMEIRLLSGEKRAEWFVLFAEPYYNEEGELELWFGSCINIHKQKMRELSNYSSYENSLLKAHKTIDVHKERFIQIAMNQSHLIRKPLANVLGILSLLNDMDFPEEAWELLKLLNVSAEELDDTIKEVIGAASNSF